MREWSTASTLAPPWGGPARGFGLSHPGALAALSEIHLGSRYPLGHFRGCFGLRLRFAVLPDLVGQLRHPLFTIVRCVTCSTSRNTVLHRDAGGRWPRRTRPRIGGRGGVDTGRPERAPGGAAACQGHDGFSARPRGDAEPPPRPRPSPRLGVSPLAPRRI